MILQGSRCVLLFLKFKVIVILYHNLLIFENSNKRTNLEYFTMTMSLSWFQVPQETFLLRNMVAKISLRTTFCTEKHFYTFLNFMN